MTGNSDGLIFGTKDFTISVWIKFPISSSNIWSGIITKGMTTEALAHTWGLCRRSDYTNRVAFLQATDAGGAFGANIESNTFSDGWHFVTITRNGSTTKMYSDGQYINQDTSAGDNLSATNPLLIGRSDVYTSTTIDDVRIYNAALSSSQIKQNYIAGLNSLLGKGLISEGEYNQRIEELSSK
ncbi:MAG: LamG domain-containing protein [Candidatus Pacebacteria bacterium]|nr:LamG domain-containing protein [Candidatus Paceibacterota bacterium]